MLDSERVQIYRDAIQGKAELDELVSEPRSDLFNFLIAICLEIQSIRSEDIADLKARLERNIIL